MQASLHWTDLLAALLCEKQKAQDQMQALLLDKAADVLTRLMALLHATAPQALAKEKYPTPSPADPGDLSKRPLHLGSPMAGTIPDEFDTLEIQRLVHEQRLSLIRHIFIDKMKQDPDRETVTRQLQHLLLTIYREVQRQTELLYLWTLALELNDSEKKAAVNMAQHAGYPLIPPPDETYIHFKMLAKRQDFLNTLSKFVTHDALFVALGLHFKNTPFEEEMTLFAWMAVDLALYDRDMRLVWDHTTDVAFFNYQLGTCNQPLLLEPALVTVNWLDKVGPVGTVQVIRKGVVEMPQ
jgi:hypothetical protein